MVVMKGCPATLARTLRSFRTCSTCLRRITARGCQQRRRNSPHYIPSTLRRIFSANTLSSSSALHSFRRTSHTRAKVPDKCQHMPFHPQAMRTSAQCLDELKVFLAQHFGRVADDLCVGVLFDLLRTHGVLRLFPLRQVLLLFLTRAVHGRVVAVVQWTGLLVLRTLLLVPVMLHRVEKVLHGGRHGCCVGQARAGR